jgi:Thioesterase-like superfamily
LSFFVARGEGRFEATTWTRGPWDPLHQHAGPQAALLAGELARAGTPGMVFARLTYEILGAIPVGPIEVSTVVERPGRSVELLAGEVRAGGRPVVRARAWRVQPSPAEGPNGSPPLQLPEVAQPAPPSFGEFGYAGAIEWRWARGGWLEPGPAVVWTRLQVPIVEGEEIQPLQRVLVVADSGNGVSAVLDWGTHLFINPELSVHVLREPRGEWVCLDARTQIAAGGAGLASSVISDADGPVARGAQALLIAPRAPARRGGA